ncbi:hypothetical protein IFM89_012496 [Coptis chinensis]|uniref:ATPase AAA-type core domain-containing protein n=1 Tax=Coptis chinensis TaxID=261450 RepID=A0A835M373_9MAGN|nr:hypothetical protein IFM89_012496 [Coptis chinensis]
MDSRPGLSKTGSTCLEEDFFGKCFLLQLKLPRTVIAHLRNRMANWNESREHAPSIIFMAEIDSIGSARMEFGSGNGNSEVQRTMLEHLNQLDGLTWLLELTGTIKGGFGHQYLDKFQSPSSARADYSYLIKLLLNDISCTEKLIFWFRIAKARHGCDASKVLALDNNAIFCLLISID